MAGPERPVDPAVLPSPEAAEGPAWCGLEVMDDGRVKRWVDAGPGVRREEAGGLEPVAWLGEASAGEWPGEWPALRRLRGGGALAVQGRFPSPKVARTWIRGREDVECPAPLETQVLLQARRRLFSGGGFGFGSLRRCTLDIETASAAGRFPDAAEAEDRVLAIGLSVDGRDRTLVLEARTDAAEKALLERFVAVLAEEDPDTLEGHNVFKFDLEYLRVRSKRHGVPCAWGRGGALARFRSSRFKVAERQLDFPRCDVPGRAVVDTYFLVQLHDVTVREMPGYGLKEAAVHFGLTREADERTYLEGAAIDPAFDADRGLFLAYLADDLRETRGLADLLVPTYFEQARTFPITLQDAIVRGTAAKIDLLFLEAYHHAGEALGVPPAIAPFEGGFTRSYREGVFRQVLHFDVASLYPSLLLVIGRSPEPDSLGLFLPLLRELRAYRLRFKALARSAADPAVRAEASARQAAYKILINSFYGYLGFPGARFGDGVLAAEVTRRGRELLQSLLARLEALGAEPLEADTDGIYAASPEHWADPGALLERLQEILPAGIELEFDGRYEVMVCYKAKNYALRDGDAVIVRGSALRSRGTEPFLRRLTDCLLRYLLGLEGESPLVLAERLKEDLRAQRLAVAEVARTESLGQPPEAYRAWVEGGGKPRRAAQEVALVMDPVPRMGEKVRFYAVPKKKGQTAEWQRARPLAAYDPVAAPYDGEGYAAKVDDWVERYAVFLGRPGGSERAGELSLGDESTA